MLRSRSMILFPLSSLPPKHRTRIPFTPFSPSTTIAAASHRPPPVCRNSPPPNFPPPTSAYIHLPFCRKRCHYCDFPIVALGSSSSSSSSSDDPRVANYIRLLLREIAAVGSRSDARPPLDTVFFGGGTPSLVPPRLVAEIVDALRSEFGTRGTPEVSIEMDPGTFDAQRLDQLVRLAGVNRVSLGVQAFQDELLSACGRAHGLSEAWEAIEVVAKCVDNWSIDLISSLPRQTSEMWEESLRCAVDAGSTHISVYDLQVEQGTKFGQLYKPGEFPLPSETQSADFYRAASSTLTAAGYNHYEISSYCRSGYECEHNFAYWENKPFYGFGLGAASYVNGVRFSRPRSLKEYAGYVQRLEEGAVDMNTDSNGARNAVDAKEMAMDVAMLSLRTARGLALSDYRRSFGDLMAFSICKVFEPYVESGHVIAMDGERRALSYKDFEGLISDGCGSVDGVGFVRLSDPDGFLLSNELISIAFGAISP